MKSNTNFYNDLLLHDISVRKLLKKEHLFIDVPKNWHVIVTDIRDSTSAIKNGLHNDVNLVATGCIITVLNTIKLIDKNASIPYFFGGDGATFIIPESYVEKVEIALENYSIHIKKSFNFVLVIGKMLVEDIYKNKTTLKIAKLKLNGFLTTPVVLGNGLKFVESAIKDSFIEKQKDPSINYSLNLEGMECRWDEIFPNSEDKKVACLLVFSKEEKNQAKIYREIMDNIDVIFGNLKQRNPVTSLKLKLNTSIQKIRHEMYSRLGKYNRGYIVKNWLITFFGKYYFKFFVGGKKYLLKVTQLSDTIMLDGSINTVFSGTQQQLDKLRFFLDKLESDNKITYGLHSTYASIMSCYVEDRDKKHIHFVDATEGGYTSAANQIKVKLKNNLT